ncbi:hypothetical protein NLM33_38450 [Bradyrhizobium sp. CCGUVB1N3]|uniref:hypothetical protein n=1 Tax=Bradyrhizobium sp. CCGUVB1N3 TaxID=2949629 RepID=UPI0020B43D3E|nr:hypothetical protein [Bradyrhizobium sp. CCGUVB1N3]MCP3476112.1 hypothetical protein [Bradyrhizobium sp. CCGUVB1N3]
MDASLSFATNSIAQTVCRCLAIITHPQGDCLPKFLALQSGCGWRWPSPLPEPSKSVGCRYEFPEYTPIANRPCTISCARALRDAVSLKSFFLDSENKKIVEGREERTQQRQLDDRHTPITVPATVGFDGKEVDRLVLILPATA